MKLKHQIMAMVGICLLTYSCHNKTVIQSPESSQTSLDSYASELQEEEMARIVHGHIETSLKQVSEVQLGRKDSQAQAAQHTEVIMSANLSASSCSAGERSIGERVTCLAIENLPGNALPSYAESIKNHNSELSERLNRLGGVLSLFFLRKFSYKKPLLAESFIRGRTFVMTASINRMATSSPVLSRVFNMSSLRVRMDAGPDTLRIFSLPRNAGGSEQLVGAFPITANYKRGSARYFEVDFAKPNPSFMFPIFTAFLEESAADFAIEAFLPRVVRENGDVTNLTFEHSDKSLVLDAITLWKLDPSLVETSDTDLANAYNVLRPTMKMNVGFLLEEDSSLMQPTSLNDATSSMGLSGLANLQSGGAQGAASYFLADRYSRDDNGRAEVSELNIRKVNLKKGMTFVLRGDMDDKVKSIISESVGVWNHHLKRMAPSSSRGNILSVTTVDERLYLSAGDPRISTITWDQNPSLSVAWATTLGHPRSGEIISGDVFIAGKSWAMNGCITYFERKWTRANQDSARTPPGEMYRMWLGVCGVVLEKLGIYPEEEIELPFDIGDLTAALDAGDHERVLRLKYKLLGPTQAPRNTELKIAQVYEPVLSFLQDHPLSKNSQRNQGHLHVDCVKFASDVEELSETGAPLVSSEIATPEDAALAGIKSVLIHEIGHIVGLRHNFLGSTNKGHITQPLASLSRTKSIMDYNDFAIDMDAGVRGKMDQTLGDWDILALNTVYGDGRIVLKRASSDHLSLPFCTDQNVGVVENCHRHDFGSSYLQYSFYQVNRIVAQLQPTGLGTDQGLVARLSGHIAEM